MQRYLFVIDYQNDFVDGALGFPGAEKLDERIADKVRRYGPGRVFFTRDTHSRDYLQTREGRHLPIVHCVRDTPGWQLYGRTAEACAQVGATAIDKQVFGMDVTDPAVAAVLPETADEIELVGLVSSICVISNACVLQAKYPQAQLIVDAACTAGLTEEMNEKVLDVMENLQIRVINRK